jgi:hypothetical protein
VEDAFVEACARDQDFLNTIRIWVSSQMKTSASKEMTARELFHRLDLDNSGTICREEMMMFVQERIRNSWEMYAIDTVALASISVAGVHGAIAMGLHPLVASTSGVTMSLGGVLRDIFCGQDVAIASQSYAFATGAGSAVYVLINWL